MELKKNYADTVTSAYEKIRSKIIIQVNFWKRFNLSPFYIAKSTTWDVFSTLTKFKQLGGRIWFFRLSEATKMLPRQKFLITYHWAVWAFLK
jgi:hypothetical protein